MPELLDIAGQDPAIALLERQLTAGRLHHALLFAGPDGVGKQTAAEALGRAVLCHQPARTSNASRLSDLPDDAELLQACGSCDDCRMLASGSHPDFQVVRKELAAYHPDAQVRSRTMQELGIDVLREFLIGPAGRSASRGRGKVYVVCEAHLMSTAAQNALLKTLEEPPSGVTLILLTTKPDRLLPTTLSRCCRVNFHFLPLPFVAEKLSAAGIEPTEAGFWARFTHGSIGRSVGLSGRGMYALKQEMVEGLGDLPAASVTDYGKQLAEAMDKLAESEVRQSKKTEGPTLSKNLASRTAAGDMLQLLASVFRDAIVVAGGADLPLVHADQRDVVLALSQRFDFIQLAEIIEQLSEYERLLWRNVNPKTVWDNVAITCSSAAPLKL